MINQQFYSRNNGEIADHMIILRHGCGDCIKETFDPSIVPIKRRYNKQIYQHSQRQAGSGAVGMSDHTLATRPSKCFQMLRESAFLRLETAAAGGGTVGVAVDDAAVAAAGRRAAAEVGPRVRSLLAADIDEQRTGPLALVRHAVAYPASVLSAAGVAPVERDADAVRLFPDDAYDLSPASFAELHPDLRGPGLEWGAAKAHVHRRRHGAHPGFADSGG